MHKEAQKITEHCLSELNFKTSRSSGAGGQHVNKVETRITLRWNINKSEILTDQQKELINEKLSNYINKNGELIIHDESSRSQVKNRESAIRKWGKLLSKAFYKPKSRKVSKPSKAAMAKRRKAKEKRSGLKAERRWSNKDHN